MTYSFIKVPFEANIWHIIYADYLKLGFSLWLQISSHFTLDTLPATNVFSYVCNFVCITHQLSINHVFVVFNDPTTIIDSSKPQSYIHFFFTHTLPRTVRVIFFQCCYFTQKGYWWLLIIFRFLHVMTS